MTKKEYRMLLNHQCNNAAITIQVQSNTIKTSLEAKVLIIFRRLSTNITIIVISFLLILTHT